MKKIWGVIRTKGAAPYLNYIIQEGLRNLDGIVLIDNNAIPMHSMRHTKILYRHDPRQIINMCSNEQKILHEKGDHHNKNSLASFYRDAFNLAPKDAWQLKLDDDDAWSGEQWKSMRKNIEKSPDNGIVYFSGINWLGGDQISSVTPICGGRDHFALGPQCVFDWRNGAEWEEIELAPSTPKRYAGLKYIHLKFYGKSLGYAKDLVVSNKSYLEKVERNNRTGVSPYDVSPPIIWRILSILSWKLMPNKWLGANDLKFFWKNTQQIRDEIQKVDIK